MTPAPNIELATPSPAHFPSKASGLPIGVFAMDPDALHTVYSEQDRRRIAERVAICDDLVLTPDNWRSHRNLLLDTEFVFAGWKAPSFDADFLAAAPKLRAIFYAAGSVRYCTPEAFWRKDIPISSAYAANAIPVAEYTAAVTILSLKQFWRRADHARRGEGWGDHTRPIRGSFRATLGFVSFGMIARSVVEKLANYDIRMIVYCPYLTQTEANTLGVKIVSIEELFRESDVVSIHTPVLPQTIGLIKGDLVLSMKPDATLINTARGVILNQKSVVEALRKRPDLTAVLDVTDPEPPAASDPLFQLPNVIVTPHIAGSLGMECQRMGNYMTEELKRFLAGEPLRWRITREMSLGMA